MAVNETLKRFHEAQRRKSQGRSTYDIAHAEIYAGKKVSHWIWYIFPQLKVLGKSENALYYGINDLQEACDYLNDSVLFMRYHTMVMLAHSKLGAGVPIHVLMGGAVDANKLVSSLTLFRAAARHLVSINDGSSHELDMLAQQCDDILQHHGACKRTLEHIASANSLPETRVLTREAGPKPKPESDVEIISRVVVEVLDSYIKQRAQEPNYWFQGLFKGFSKTDKLKAAISLRLTLANSIEDHSALAMIIKSNGLDIEQLRHRDVHHDLAILCQGRLGTRLRNIARADNHGEWYQSLPRASQTEYPPRTVRDLIQYLLTHRIPDNTATPLGNVPDGLNEAKKQ